LEAYFYLNKISCHRKVKLVIYKLTCGYEEYWFEVLEYKDYTDKPLILSWKTLRKSLILEFVRGEK